GDGASIRHGERPRAVRTAVVRRWWQVTENHLLGQLDPFVLLQRSPDEHDQPAPRAHCAPYVFEGCDGVLKEHRTEAREAEIERSIERVRLSVCDFETNVASRRPFGIGTTECNERLGAVDAEHASFVADERGELERGLAAPAPHVQDSLTRADWMS